MNATLALIVACAAHAGAPAGVWTTPEELAGLPTSGPSWDALVALAATPAHRPVLSANGDDMDILAMAKALVPVQAFRNKYGEFNADGMSRRLHEMAEQFLADAPREHKPHLLTS